MGTGRRTLRVLLVNLTVLAAGLLIVELLFGQWLRPSRRIDRLNLIIGRTLYYDVTPLYRDGDRRAIHKRDQFGFRGAYPAPSRIDILTVGGSTTAQTFITEGKTWQDVLAREFRKAGKSVSVVNAGVNGQSTHGHAKNFDWWFPFIPGLRVKYFLFYVGINDFNFGEDPPSDSSKPLRGFRWLLSENSALYQLQSRTRGMYRAWRYGASQVGVDLSKKKWTAVPRQSDYPKIMQGRLAAYRQRLQAVLEKCRRFGGGAICVTQRTRKSKLVDGTVLGVAKTSRYDEYEINGVDAYYMEGLLNQATLDVCREAGALTVDVAEGVEWEDADFYDFSHNTPHGAEKIGQHLYAHVKGLF